MSGNLFQKKKGYIGLLCMGVVCLLLGGCSNREIRTDAEYKVMVICKGSQHEFWQTARMGAEDACEELGMDMVFKAPENETQVDVQIQMMETAIAQKVDGILLAPLDSEKLNASIEKAVEQGIKVVTFDSDVTTSKRSSVIGTSNESAGAIAARNALQMVPDSATIAVVAHVKGSQTAEERKNGFLTQLKEEKEKSITILEPVYCDGDAERSRQATKRLIQDNPDLNLIYATNEGSAVGAAQAVKELGKAGRIHVIGFDSSDEEIDYLKSGIIDGMLVQNPYNMGYLGIRNLYKIMKGQSVDEVIDTGAHYVNRENWEDEDVQWLLYPMGK